MKRYSGKPERKNLVKRARARIYGQVIENVEKINPITMSHLAYAV
jgi:hypothetical protein